MLRAKTPGAPRPRPTRLVTRVALLAAVTIALGFLYIPLPFSPVPITGQTLGVMLSGALLGRWGALSQLLVLLLCAAGAPVLAGGRGGWAVLAGPTAGYLWMFPLAALGIGWVAERVQGRIAPLLAAHLLFGLVLVDAVGTWIYAEQSGLRFTAALIGGALPFLPGDLLKCVASTLLARSLGRALAWSGFRPDAA